MKICTLGCPHPAARPDEPCVWVGMRVDLYMFWYIYMYLCLYIYISACKNARMFEQIKHPAKLLDYSL